MARRTSLALVLLLLSGPLGHAAPARKTILDYFRTIPIHYLSSNGLAFDRIRSLTVQDLANGFLKYEVSDAPLEGQVTLFRKTDGSPLVALVIDDCGGCGEGYHQTLHFLEEHHGKWIDRIKTVLPPITEAMLVAQINKVTGRTVTVDQTNHVYPDYRLPQHGTTIIVQEQGNVPTPLFHLHWNKTRFDLRAP
ncbi:MAG: hypothetical protein HY696_08600 [Deltaproteobacteria bacterium]|nr:hypothetical protein [Deltaproteobacteria bacterium]